MYYFLDKPGLLILVFFQVVGWLLLVIGLIKLVMIIKNRISWGSGFSTRKNVIVSVIMFVIGLMILILLTLYGDALMPAGWV
jgi:hypothetical protein